MLRSNLQAMYHGKSSSERKSADKFLQKLQRDSGGWQLADAILGGRTQLASLEGFASEPLASEALVFAAMTLNVKVCGDLHELSAEEQGGLRDASLAHLSHWGTAVGAPPALVKKLALAVAGLAVRTSWRDALAYVEAQLAGAQGACSTVLGSDGCSLEEAASAVEAASRVRLVAVEVLTALPEQCASRRLSVTRAARETYSEFLRSASAGAVAAMTSVVGATAEAQRALDSRKPAQTDAARQMLAASAEAASRLTARVFGCLQSWMCWSEIDASVLASNPLFLGTFEALGHNDLFDVACEVIVETLRAYDCAAPGNQALVAAVAPRVMNLRARFEAATASGDEDDASGLCRLFCEMGEAYMPLIASPNEANQLAIVDLELCCARHSSRRVADQALRFFYKLSRAWVAMPDDEEGAAGKQRLRQQLMEPFSQLARLCVDQAARTEDDGNLEAFARDENNVSDDFARHRNDLYDALGDCAYFLGPDALLSALAEKLESAASGGQDRLEACFFALRAIAEWVPDTEDRVLPAAFRFALQLPADWRAALRSAAGMMGAYSNWLKAHAVDLLEPVFSFLVNQLETTAARNANRAAQQQQQQRQQQRRPANASSLSGPSVAAKALRSVCSACRTELAAVGTVLDLGIRLGPMGIALRDELEVLEGLSDVVAAAPTLDALAAGLEKLITPPANALAGYASTGGADPKLVVNELERLTSVVRCAAPPRHLLEADPTRRPHPVLTVFERLWPVFQALADSYREQEHLIERMCRCYKHAMRSCRRHFEPMLQPMIAHLVHYFAQTRLSSFLYASSICITEFGHDPSKHAILFNMLAAFAGTVFGFLTTLEDFRSKPDVVEEFFYLASRFLDYCPDTLVGNADLLANILRCGVVGLALEHREAQRGVLHCFERTVVVALAAWQHANAPAAAQDDGRRVDDHRAHRLRQLLVDRGLGREIADGVLKSLTGNLPAYALDEGRGSLVGVLWRLRLFCPTELPVWCAASLHHVPDRFASNDIKADLLNSISNYPPNKDHFFEVRFLFSRLTCLAVSPRLLGSMSRSRKDPTQSVVFLLGGVVSSPRLHHDNIKLHPPPADNTVEWARPFHGRHVHLPRQPPLMTSTPAASLLNEATSKKRTRLRTRVMIISPLI